MYGFGGMPADVVLAVCHDGLAEAALGGHTVNTHGTIGVVILLAAGTVQAVNTVSMLSGKGLVQTEPGQIVPMGPWNEGMPEEQEEPLRIFDEAVGTLPWESCVGLQTGSVELGEPVVSAVHTENGAVVHPPASLLDGFEPNAAWGMSGPWNAEPKEYPDAHVVSSAGSIQLSVSGETDWIPASLAKTQESFIMVFVVLPSLVAMTLVLAARLLVVRVRRRRSPALLQELLQE